MHGEPLTSEQLQAISEAGDPLLRGVAIIVAAIVAGWVFRRDSLKWPVEKGQRFDLLVVVFLGSLVGAALPAQIAGGLVEELSDHGLVFGPNTIIGALVGGFFAAAIYKKLRGIHYDTSDDFVLGTVLAMAVGRLGCHLGHCCIGRASGGPWAMNFGDGIPRIPSQLVEAGCMFGLFALFYTLDRKHMFPNRRLFIFMVAYGLVRFVMEFLRAPIAGKILGLGSYQWFALGLVALGVFQIIRRGQAATHAPAEPA